MVNSTYKLRTYSGNLITVRKKTLNTIVHTLKSFIKCGYPSDFCNDGLFVVSAGATDGLVYPVLRVRYLNKHFVKGIVNHYVTSYLNPILDEPLLVDSPCDIFGNVLSDSRFSMRLSKLNDFYLNSNELIFGANFLKVLVLPPLMGKSRPRFKVSLSDSYMGIYKSKTFDIDDYSLINDIYVLYEAYREWSNNLSSTVKEFLGYSCSPASFAVFCVHIENIIDKAKKTERYAKLKGAS